MNRAIIFATAVAAASTMASSLDHELHPAPDTTKINPPSTVENNIKPGLPDFQLSEKLLESMDLADATQVAVSSSNKSAEFMEIKNLGYFKDSDVSFLLKVMDPNESHRSFTTTVSSQYHTSVKDVVDGLVNFFESKKMNFNIKGTGRKIDSSCTEDKLLGYVTVTNLSKPMPTEPEVIKTQIRYVERTIQELENNHLSNIAYELQAQVDELYDVLNGLIREVSDLQDKTDSLDSRVSNLENKDLFNDVRILRIEQRLDGLESEVTLEPFTLEPKERTGHVFYFGSQSDELSKPMDKPKLSKDFSPLRGFRLNSKISENTVGFGFEIGGKLSLIFGADMNTEHTSMKTTAFELGGAYSTYHIQFETGIENTFHIVNGDTLNYKPIIIEKANDVFTLRNIWLGVRTAMALSDNFWFEPSTRLYVPISYDPGGADITFSGTLFYKKVGLGFENRVYDIKKGTYNAPYLLFVLNF